MSFKGVQLGAVPPFFRKVNTMQNSYKNISSFCKDFRIDVLKKTIADLSRASGVKERTLWAFENGKANNINHLSVYFDECITDEARKEFLGGLETWL